MTAVAEITKEEFTAERFLPIFEQISAESGIRFDMQHLFDTWKTWLWLGLARTWAADGCILGAIFHQDLFSQKLRASVVFWFSLPAVRGTSITRDVFRTFEQAAKAAGCVEIQSAAHESITPQAREAVYLKNGFSKTETVFTKVL